MTTESIEKIVHTLTKECEKNFEKHKVEEFTLANKTTIPFLSKTLHTRKVSDWGTDEDEDEILCYSKDGWENFNITVQVGAGVQKIIEQQTVKLTEKQVVDLISALDLVSQLKFFRKAYNLLEFSEYEFELLR